MENFNLMLKKELCSLTPSVQENALSFLSAMIKTVGELSKDKNGEFVVINTEVLEVFDAVNKILNLVYGETAELNLSDEVGYTEKPKYEIILPREITKQVLTDTEVAFFDEQKYLCFFDGISKYIIETESQIVDYIKGAFLTAGTTNIVLSDEKLSTKSSGYHLEFVFSSEKLSHDFSSLLAELNIITKNLKRKDFFVVYVQDFEQILMLLQLMGTKKSIMALQNENALRDMRNKVNRQNNCEAGNISKIVNASVEQLKNIKIIQQTIGIEALERPLQTACYLRLANPDESLDNLVKLSTEKITKSGLYKRFAKIKKIASEIV